MANLINGNGKRFLHYPEQKMKAHSKAVAVEKVGDESDEELAELVNRDPFVQGLIMKSGQGGHKQDDK